tara:strand:+ start:3538 stop:4044 length:507 start_codon:yes stop_codon:yes gene_type:complete
MEELLEIVDNVAVPSAYTLTIKAFKGLNNKELAYIYFMADHRSPYAIYGEEHRKEEVISAVFKKGWEPSGKVLIAVEVYKELKETSAVKLLRSARASIVKLQEYFELIDLREEDDNGKLRYNAKDLVANLANMGKVVEGLSQLEAQVKKEAQVSGQLRGHVSVDKYSE